MCAARRTTSTRLTRLAAKASPYHTAVTLYEARDTADSEAQAGPSTPRRPSRVKQEPTDPETLALDVSSDTRHGRAVSKNTKRSVKPDLDASRKSPKKPTSKPKAIRQRLDVPQPAPAKWADAYAAIKEMRSRVVAPVDTMGCDQAQLKERDPKVGLGALSPLHHYRIPLLKHFLPFGPLISTRSFHGVTHSSDAFVFIIESTVCDARLFDALLANQGRSDRRGSRETTHRTRRITFRPSRIGSRRHRHLGRHRQSRVLEAKDAVRAISFCFGPFCSLASDPGTRYIKQTARRLHDDFDADVPKTADELCSLPGVGPKMAFLALQVAWKLYVFSLHVRARIMHESSSSLIFF